jgi:diguanylate cyclase (GGDEF)-like protein
VRIKRFTRQRQRWVCDGYLGSGAVAPVPNVANAWQVFAVDGAPRWFSTFLDTEEPKSLPTKWIRLKAGVSNRRGFFEKASEAMLRAKQGAALSAILIDIDHFKEVNDLYGHKTGDDAIRAVALEAQTDEAVVGPLGGDEFSILLQGRSASEAIGFAEALRRKFAALRLKTPKGVTTLTCSLGVSELEPDDTLDALIGRADLALYRAKEEGKNRVATPPSASWIRQHPRKTETIARAHAR